jgi:hypothetical protein
MARRATLRAVLALALVAVLVSAQDASCETQGSCDAGLASPDVSTVAPAIEATTVEATPETAKAPEPESDSPRLDPPPDAMPPVESATPPRSRTASTRWRTRSRWRTTPRSRRHSDSSWSAREPRSKDSSGGWLSTND